MGPIAVWPKGDGTTKSFTVGTTVKSNESQEVSRTLISPVVLDAFQLVRLRDMNNVFGLIQMTTCALDPHG